MITIGAAIVAVLIGWSMRPRPAVRVAPVARRRSWRWAVVPALLAAIASPVLGVALAIILAVWRRWASVRRTRTSARQVAGAFPDALDLLVLSIRAGYLPSQAIVEIIPFLPAPLAAAFAAVGEALGRGTRFADALGELTERLGEIAQPLADSLSAADRYGLPLAPVLERLAFDARQQRRREAEATARELPVRLAMPLVLCTLPSFVLLAIVPLLLGALSSLHP